MKLLPNSPRHKRQREAGGPRREITDTFWGRQPLLDLRKEFFQYLFMIELQLFYFFFFYRFFLLVFRQSGRQGEREGNISVWLPLARPLLATLSATQACALTGNWAGDPLVFRQVLNPLSHTSQGYIFFLFFLWAFIKLKYKFIDTDNSMVITRGEGLGSGRKGYKGINGDGRRVDLDW